MSNPHEKADATPIDVAVGVLIRPDGAFLLAQRPPGKPMAGYWEFPGGKLEAGESVFDALLREFDEELGITITRAHPWTQRVVVYPHATVRLHFWRAFEWNGAPVGREGQAFRWEHADRITSEPWLIGAFPARRWLQLPPVYAISDATRIGADAFLRRLDARLQEGRFCMMQWREKPAADPGQPTLGEATLAALFGEVLLRCRDHGVRLLVNSAHPASWWRKADGVHMRASDLMRLTTRPDAEWCIASCHDAAELARAGELEFDAAVLGPVAPTASHPEAAPLGWAGFRGIAGATRIPVYALGGMQLADLPQAIAEGAHGIAMIRNAWCRASPP